ncbi:Macrolide export ATP-binding/permease protein MacB [Emticicia aquatica]|jgi:putative ABC transport system permease protein|uniref:Macrolide export ATP-binding/permease protein MacB n=1 Tax=Emticicia aquatica TaxID=1681835 RepID=A0ABN8EQI8_9BACT|nr:ABC transporter permease [Emticicia aquatica]CAH0994905.1 Macrolide export ATP-binding/permease protein MacB [Emticicia aquatica]
MNLTENISEGLRSIKGNMLRTVLTALIIAIGITSLVGILTAIDGMQSSVDNSFAGLGANSFDIKGPRMWRRRSSGVNDKDYPPIEYREAKLYKELFQGKTSATISIYTNVSGAAQLKYKSVKTNPNSLIRGVDEDYINIKGYKLISGRDITENDINLTNNVVILANELATTLFPKENPIDKDITLLGLRFKVIGVLEKKGSITGGGDDRVALVPLETGRQIAGNRKLTFDITTSVNNVSDMDYILGEAEAVMRRVRKDQIGQAKSFEIERSDALAKDFEEVTGYLRVGGFGIGIITLLGAAIALMNIMMVSVTERTREIGIRKAIGATPFKIRLQFLMEAIVICILGGIAGIIMGIGIGNLIAKLISDKSSFIIPWAWIFMGFVVCVVVGILSGFYPAYKASKLDPIESLRYE